MKQLDALAARGPAVRPSAPRCASLRSHAFWLVLCALPWLVGPFLDVTPEAASLAGIQAPACPSRWIAPEVGCPGCGLTRSVGFALQGDLGAAWTLHPGGLALLLLCLGGLLLHGGVLLRGTVAPGLLRASRWGRHVLLVCLLGGWFIRIL